jgi:oligoribonuclease (3'-5' exoribonuclease)
MAESQNSEKKEAAIAMQWHSKHVSMARNKTCNNGVTMETMFTLRFVPMLYSKDHPRVVRQ